RSVGALRCPHLAGKLEVVGEGAGRRERLPGLLLGRLALPQQLGQGLQVAAKVVEAFGRVELLLESARLPQDLLGLLGAGPEVRRRGLLPQTRKRAPRRVQIKDSPEAPRGAPRRPRGRRRDRRVRSCEVW